jgi:hypothetical protein
MVTLSPRVSGLPMSVCSIDRSCTLVLRPMRIGSLSPRTTAPNHTLEFSAMYTSPITCALSATQVPSPKRGALPSNS